MWHNIIGMIHFLCQNLTKNFCQNVTKNFPLLFLIRSHYRGRPPEGVSSKNHNTKYRIIWKTTPHYMRFWKIKNRLIHKVLENLWRYNATSMAIFSPYIRDRVVTQVVLFSRFYTVYNKHIITKFSPTGKMHL